MGSDLICPSIHQPIHSSRTHKPDRSSFQKRYLNLLHGIQARYSKLDIRIKHLFFQFCTYPPSQINAIPWQKVALELHKNKTVSAISCAVPGRFMGAIAIAGLYVSMCGLVMGVSMTPGQTLKKKEVIKKKDECQSVGRSSVVVSQVSEMRCGVVFFVSSFD